MDINAIILAWMLAMNALIAQGWTYDIEANEMKPPAVRNQGTDVYLDRRRSNRNRDL